MLRFFPVTKEKLIALVYGIVCHCLFILAAILMSLSLFSGFSWQVSLNSGSSLTWINLFLLIQFPFFHSLLLMPSGKRILRIFSSSKLLGTLSGLKLIAELSFQKYSCTGTTVKKLSYFSKLERNFSMQSSIVSLDISGEVEKVYKRTSHSDTECNP